MIIDETILEKYPLSFSTYDGTVSTGRIQLPSSLVFRMEDTERGVRSRICIRRIGKSSGVLNLDGMREALWETTSEAIGLTTLHDVLTL